MQEVLLEGNSDSGFTTSREASKPQSKAFLAPKGAALLVRDGRRVPCYVANSFKELVIVGGDPKRGDCAHLRSHRDSPKADERQTKLVEFLVRMNETLVGINRRKDSHHGTKSSAQTR